MAKYSITIKYGEKANELSELGELINSFNEKLGKFHTVRKTEKEVIESLNRLVQERSSELKAEYDKVVEFFKSKMNKLWLMRITKGEGECKFTDEMLIYVYHVQESDGCLECLYSSNVGGGLDKHKFEFNDGYIDIETLCYSVRGTVIELEEISKDYAFEIFNKRINKIIDYRLERLKEKEKNM